MAAHLGLNVCPAQVALAWVREQAGVSSMIVGADSEWQVDQAVQVAGPRAPCMLPS